MAYQCHACMQVYGGLDKRAVTVYRYAYTKLEFLVRAKLDEEILLLL